MAALLFFIGVLQISGYYFAGATVRSDGEFAVPQPDTMLYCQSAKRIVEGHPFSFSKGEAPTTGTTSHLYPFVLAAPYAMGASGDSLFRAGFFLNAGFYLIFLFAWGAIIRAKCNDELTSYVAVALVALFGQSAFSAFSQTDIGFWMAASALFALGLATEKPFLYGTMLVVAPWIRPEGMYCVIGFGMAVAVKTMLGSKLPGVRRRADMGILSLALLSFVGVFAFNLWLTGSPTFSSLAHKGHFATKPFAIAVFATASDLLAMVKSILLGIPTKIPRDFYFIPVIGAFLLWIGFLCRNWRENFNWRELAWWFAASGGVLSVAMSGMQDMNMDRYLAWIMPVLSVFVAAGASHVRDWLSRTGGFANLPIAACLLFAVGMAFTNMCVLQATSVHSDLRRDFTRRCAEAIGPGASVGSWGCSGGVYELGDRRFAHLCGIYSADFMSRNIECGTFEKLKHNPELRFDYFLKWGSSVEPGFGEGEPFADSLAEMAGPDGMEMRRMKWTSFNAGAATPRCPVPGRTLQARVDVAHDHDEIAAGYRVVPTYDIPVFDPFYHTAKNGEIIMTDCGRIVLGYDEMSVPLIPGRDVQVVMRVCPKAQATLDTYGGGRHEYAFANPLKLNLAVDGELIGMVEIAYAEDGFSDVSFAIPGSAIKNKLPRVGFLGDHIVCGYWFFQ